jgi:hypothetical protein
MASGIATAATSSAPIADAPGKLGGKLLISA